MVPTHDSATWTDSRHRQPAVVGCLGDGRSVLLSFLNGHPRLGGGLAEASSVVDGADGDLAA